MRVRLCSIVALLFLRRLRSEFILREDRLRWFSPVGLFLHTAILSARRTDLQTVAARQRHPSKIELRHDSASNFRDRYRISRSPTTGL